MLFGLLLCGHVYAEDTDKNGDSSKTEEDENPTLVGCSDVADKLAVIIPLQEAVIRDLASVTDASLCPVMEKQCDYFYKMVSNHVAYYKSKCDSQAYFQSPASCQLNESVCGSSINADNRVFQNTDTLN